ncbi:TPA: hypothetical protein NV425_005858 [Pseudomonas aeruginosa]|nr:hypothetical protein [Pseudomonas aeruginosa]
MNESKICTCPSGDGSLRWPCPAHPAVEQAGWDERAAFEAAFAAMGRPVCRADYDQDAYGTPFDDGGWTGWQARAALAQPSPAQSEQHWPKLEKPAQVGAIRFRAGLSSRLVVEAAQRLYEFESTPEQEAERPEVVAYRTIGRHEKHQHPHYALNYYKQNAEDQATHWRERGCEVSEDELMTVAQHERIVGALRAKAAQLREALEWRAENQAGQRELLRSVTAERDAALARVEQQERTIAGINEAHAKLAGLYEAAQAQHSVPGDIMRDAQRYRWLRDQQFYFSFSTENSDAGISSCTAGMSSRFKNLSWVDAAIDSAIAAAPGKEVGHE